MVEPSADGGADLEKEERLMKTPKVLVGLAVHKNTIVAAVLPAEGERVTETVRIENQPQAMERLATRVARGGRVRL